MRVVTNVSISKRGIAYILRFYLAPVNENMLVFEPQQVNYVSFSFELP